MAYILLLSVDSFTAPSPLLFSFGKLKLYISDYLSSEDYSAEGSSDVNDQNVWYSAHSVDML
jgi:hypothetical protein